MKNVDFSRRRFQVLIATLGVHGRREDGMGPTARRPTMGRT